MPQRSLLVLGLANGGKTTLVNCLKPTRDRDQEVAPTVGFAVERFTLHKCKLTVIDMSGQERYQDLWECYYKECQAVVFVVDAASNLARLEEARDMLHAALVHEQLAATPLLVFANKSDLPAARSAAGRRRRSASDGRGVRGEGVAHRRVQRAHGEGIDEGIRWLIGKL